MSRIKVFVTGGSGFVASHLLNRLDSEGKYQTVASSRGGHASGSVNFFPSGYIGSKTNWALGLKGIEVVIHCAARVHIMSDEAPSALEEFRKVNVVGTWNLARQASQANVKRFIFISSIKVNGEGTTQSHPYRADDQAKPQDAYGISKCEAEQGLLALAAETGMQVVIIRPVLVYGPGVKANFLSMMRWLSRGIPLPFGAIHNKRSLVGLDNLVDLIVTCIDHPAAANQVFLVSDGDDLSTTDLLRRMANAMGKSARLLPVPAWLLEFGARLLGKQDLARRLCGSLQVDISKTRELLGWTPPVSVNEGLRKTAEYFLEHRSK